MAKAVWSDTQVIAQLDSGYHLTGTTLTYGFPTNATWFPYTEATGFSTLTTEQRAMATMAIGLWDDLTPINFSLAADGATATVKYSNTTTNIGYAHAYYPGSWSGASSVWFNPTYNSSWGTNNLIPPTVGQWGWSAFVHETGHALGLDHPGTYNGGSPTYATDALYMQDSQQYTIMSYFSASNTGADWVASNGAQYYAQTPMIDDIMTIQAMYGVSTTTRTGDTVYGFNSNAGVAVFDFTQNQHPVVAIFDSAGNDTIDLSGFSTPSLINLTPGSFSNADAMTYNISIARTAWIENAVGGAGADTLLGNIQNNTLTGNGGNDTIDGGFGIDTAAFSGNLANYTIVWNIATDSFTITDTRTTGSTGTDTLRWVENFRFADQTVAASTYQVGGTAISVLASDTSKAEGNSGTTAFTFVVVRDGDISQAGTVNYAVTGSGAALADGGDFAGGVLPAGTVSFAAGQASATLTINVAGDAVSELDEGFTVTLSGASGGAVIANPTASGTILNEDLGASLAIAATNASLSEGDTGTTTPFTFTVTRSGDASLAGTVNWAVTGSGTNAANATDFDGGVLPTGTVSFAAEQTSATITVNVAGDATVETDETFAVTLSGASGGATIATAVATGTILNNDGTFNIAATSASKAEGSSGTTPFTFTVSRSGSAAAAATVNWAVTGGTATAADFSGGVLPFGTLNFAAGQTSATITVNVIGDTVVEGDETFTVTLSSPTGGFSPLSGTAVAPPDGFPALPVQGGFAGRLKGAGGAVIQPAQAASIGTASATGTILNDDATLAISAVSASQAEGNSGSTAFTFTVTRSGNVAGTASANWAVSGAAVNAADFAGGVLPVGTVSFAAGQTSATITVNVAGDTLAEVDEAFTVTLSGATGATIATASASGTILNDDASLNIAATSASLAEGNSGTTPFTFTVTRTGNTSGIASANWAVTGEGVDAADFGGALPSGVVNFAAGQTSATITVNVAGDAVVEGNEGFTVTLSNATGAGIGVASASGTILNDDASLSIAATNASLAEGNSGTTPFTFTVTRTGDTSGAASANWAVTGAGADAADFGGALPFGVVSFAAGQTSATITVNVAGDTAVEGSEGFAVTLSNATGAGIGVASASGTILNDDASLSIAAASASKAEGNSGTTAFTFTVTRSGDTSAAASANWTVTGAGVDAADFGGGLPSGVVSFAAGQTSATIDVNVAGDAVLEEDEGFTVTLSNASGATIGTASASGTILNDDSSLAIAATSATAAEGNAGTTPYTFTVTRTGDVSSAASANWSVAGAGGSAADAADFGGTLPGGVVTFAANQASATITVNATGDSNFEADEGFTVTLSNASGTTIGTASASGTILNDDSAPVVLPVMAIGASNATQAEGDAGTSAFTFTVTRSGDLSQTSSANWTVTGAGGSPADAADFGGALPSGVVSFAANQSTATITVNVAGDSAIEANEGFTVALSGAVGATIGTASASGTILNDDASLGIAATNASRAEGNSGSTPFTFTVTRTGDTSGAASANWAVTGAGIDAADFGGALPVGVVNFVAGQTSATITVNVSGDAAVEGNEGFTVTLANPTGATIGTGSASGTILNDDSGLSISAANASLAEGDSGTTSYTFTVTRTGDLSTIASANWAVTGAGASAADAADFGGTLPGGVVSFAANQSTATITVNVSADTIFEADEGFTVTLSNATGAVILASAASGAILNDDVQTSFAGTGGNDALNKSTMTQNLTFDLSQGGNDTATGGSGNDSFMMGGTFTAADVINGGAGSDTLALSGNYATNVTLGTTSLLNVENLTLGAGFNYNLTTNDATVAAGAALTVDARTLAGINTATVSGAAETNGRFVFLGGAGGDRFTGGAGNDTFTGGLGADVLGGGLGADTFVYTGAADSPFTLVSGVISTTGDDQISSFAAAADKIDVNVFGFTGSAANLITKSTSGFVTGATTGFFGGNGVAVEYARNGNSARVYVDANHDNNLGAGDVVIQLTGVGKSTLTNSNFVF